ncbi:glycosyl transferase, family 39 [Anaerovibrio sp. JC8]|uniref:ArnT family glycosyltransferase n=1 Tax=Anaerovibrio sp. JC8 TaxID=1240085 RepID=UPI000A0B8632|nr:glycosyltransferase family 39 protein [Anaerovibrio sp. JC8]ORT99102.1 glycosyl transferase, family 39 [Anaerovibrio sp. JC8]
MDNTKLDLSIIGIVGLVLYLLGNWAIAVTDPVESNYTLTALEMLRSGDYISPRIYGNYWYDKPAFFYWELIAAYKIFGVNEFAARFSPSLFGALGLMLTYLFAKTIYDRKTGLIAAGILGTCFEYWLLSKTIITDLTLFVFFNGVLMAFYMGYSTGKRNWYYLCYILAGLATLDKGPIGLLLPGFIIIVYLCIRRDFREILRIKWISGLLLYILTAGSWYYAMYVIHGMDFINNFLGVHNFLRATQSEHEQWNVWWYYIMIFFAGCLPWCWTLPAVIVKYFRRQQLPQLDMPAGFLLTWALVVNIFYQCMATKYTTYTLPGLLPIAILMACYLYDRETLVKRTVAVMLVVYAVLTFAVAAPVCNTKGYSYKEVAAVYKDQIKDDDVLTLYGDYKTSAVFYGDKIAYNLSHAADIPGQLPDGKSWNAKNVMPFMALEEIPEDKDVYLILHEKKYNVFEKDFKTEEWQLLKDVDYARVYVRKAKK